MDDYRAYYMITLDSMLQQQLLYIAAIKHHIGPNIARQTQLSWLLIGFCAHESIVLYCIVPLRSLVSTAC